MKQNWRLMIASAASLSIASDIRPVRRLMLFCHAFPQDRRHRRDRPEPGPGSAAALGHKGMCASRCGDRQGRGGGKRAGQSLGGHKVAEHDRGNIS